MQQHAPPFDRNGTRRSERRQRRRCPKPPVPKKPKSYKWKYTVSQKRKPPNFCQWQKLIAINQLFSSATDFKNTSDMVLPNTKTFVSSANSLTLHSVDQESRIMMSSRLLPSLLCNHVQSGILEVYGRFPDGYFPGWFFPGKTFPGKSFPGWSFSRIGRFPERRFPDGHFPGKTFPGWSFSRMTR